jgi:TRAP-type transport system periplasmic protein
MRFANWGRFPQAAAIGFALSLIGWLGPAHAQDKTYMMKVTTPTINDGPHLLAKNFAAAVDQGSGGRIKGEVYPASQLGSIPRQIEGVQFGAIQVAVVPPEFFVGIDERFEVMAAPGLVSFAGARAAPCRRSGSAQADARTWRQ